MKILFASLLLTAISLSAALAESPKSQWHADLDAAWKESQTNDQPILLFVTMDGCSFCNKMVQQTFSDDGVKSDIEASYVTAAVNGVKNPRVAQQLRVRVYPATFIVAPDARVLDRIDGYVPPQEMRQRLARAQETLQKLTPRQARLPE